MAQSTHRDPRSIITPDAFDVSEALLGMPLASPRRRAAALAIDLAAIGFLTLVTKSFSLVLGVVAAIFFVRAGFKRTPVRGSVFNRAMRLSVGCFGFFIAIVTAALWATFGPSLSNNDDSNTIDVPSAVLSGLGDNPFAAAVGVLATNALELTLAEAATLEEAEGTILEFIRAGEELGIEQNRVLDLILASIPDDASWASDAELRARSLLATELPANPEDATVAESIADEVEGLSLSAALDSYAALLASEADDRESAMRLEALEARLTDDIAADTLRSLEAHIENLEESERDERRRATAAEDALEAETSKGLFNTLRSFVDELGFGFGWASLYLTIFLSWWNGQTLGKKLLGIRVVRLDGEPISWWVAFERAGGYAAGFATGLLGFAQVYWDANRQGIHDRIVGTVVVVEGAEKVTDWESAL